MEARRGRRGAESPRGNDFISVCRDNRKAEEDVPRGSTRGGQGGLPFVILVGVFVLPVGEACSNL